MGSSVTSSDSVDSSANRDILLISVLESLILELMRDLEAKAVVETAPDVEVCLFDDRDQRRTGGSEVADSGVDSSRRLKGPTTNDGYWEGGWSSASRCRPRKGPTSQRVKG